MKGLYKIFAVSAMLTAAVSFEAGAAFPISYGAEAIMNASTGEFAPYYIASNAHGIITQQSGALLRVGASHAMERDKRFSYGFAVEALAGLVTPTDYRRYYYDEETKTGEWGWNKAGASNVWLQQLYGEIKYRSLFLTVGLKAYEPLLLNFRLSSGDLIESGNSRPIPQVRAGFIDFQNIPFTNGWVQIQGEVSYGKFTDNDWYREHYNYYNLHYNIGGYYTYKRCYFRTKPSQPLSVTVGMQNAGSFGGTTYFYSKGRPRGERKLPSDIATFFKMLIPMRNEGPAYYTGSLLGSWDVQARWRFNDGTQLKAYVTKPFEDGSGIGWLNGFDGVWGVEYVAPDAEAIVSGAVAEYIDFTNQSGPIHWAPYDSPGTTLESHTDGADDYYNNHESNAYCNYGMSIGTPFLMSPLYNLDGYMGYVDTRVRGFHIGVEGCIAHAVNYRVLGGYRKGWGAGKAPTSTAHHDTSVMVEASHRLRAVPGLSIKAQVAVDAGDMYGDSFGGLISVSYTGLLNLGKK